MGTPENPPGNTGFQSGAFPGMVHVVLYKALSLFILILIHSLIIHPTLLYPARHTSTIHYPMRPFRGLSFHVTTRTGPLKFHHDPDDDPSSEPRTRQRYIEAVTGATFKLRVNLHKDFELYTMGLDDAVRITIYYDDQKIGKFIELTRAAIVQEWSKGKSPEYTFSHVSNFCQETQQWKRGALSFGELHMSKCHGFAFHVPISDRVCRRDHRFPSSLRYTEPRQDPGEGRTGPSCPAIDADSSEKRDTEADYRSNGEDVERQCYCKYCSVR